MFALLAAARVNVQTAYAMRLVPNGRQSVAVSGMHIGGDDLGGLMAFASVTKQDEPGLKVSPTALSVNEGDPKGATYTVSLRAQLSQTINVNVLGTSGTDVSTDKTTLTFTPENWNIPQTVTVTASEDVDALNDEVTLTHFVPVGPPGLGRPALRVTVIDDEMPSTAIELNSDTTTVSESGGQRTVTVTAALNATPVTRDTVVRVDVGSGTAGQFFDFRTVDPFTILIPTGQTSATGTFTLTPVNDDVDEGDETVAIEGVFIRGPAEAALPIEGTNVTITDDDTRGVVIGTPALSIQQGRGATYEIVLTSRPTESVTVEVIAPQVDGFVLPQDTFVFGPPFWDDPKTVRLRVRDDAAVPDEPVILEHRVSGGDYEGLSADSVAVTIVERGLPTVTVEDARASEGSDALEFEVSLDAASTEQVRVHYGTLGRFLNDPEVGKATNDRDYSGKSGELVFAAGDTRKYVRVSLLDDDFHEGEETFQFSLSNPQNARLPEDSSFLQVHGIIEDDDPQPTVSLRLSDPSIPENGGSATVTARLDHLSSVDTTVTVSVTPVPPATASDVTLGSNTTLMIPARNLSRPGTVTITANDNDVGTPDKTVTVAGEAINAAGVLGPSSLTLTLEDDDTQVVIIPDEDPPVVTVEADIEEVIYNLPRDVFDLVDASFTVTRTGSTETALVVAVKLTQDKSFLAAAGLSRTVTIPSGVDLAKLEIAQSEFTGGAEADGTLTATVDNGEGYVMGTDAEASVEMRFVRPAVKVRIENSAYRFPEDQGTAEIAVIAETTTGVPAPSAAGSFDVSLSSRGDEATSPDDFNALSEIESIVAGDWIAEDDHFTARKVFEVVIQDDLVAEPDERFGMLLEQAPGFRPNWVQFLQPDGTSCGPSNLSTPCRSMVTIEDNDTARVTVTPTSLAVIEEDQTGATYTVRLTVQPTNTVMVTVTGTADTDVTVNPSSLTFTTGNWGTAQRVTVMAGADDDAGNETVTLEHSASGGGYDGVEIADVMVTVSDDDVTVQPLTVPDNEETGPPPVTVSYDSSRYTATEGGMAATVIVTLGADPEQPVVVPITAVNQGGATSDDYSGIPSNVTFEPGDRIQEFTVTATDDDIDDDGESVTLGFGTLPSRVSVGTNGTATVMLEDNDATPEITVNNARTLESSGEIVFQASMNRPSSRPVTLQCETSDDTAKVDQDYVGGQETITFLPGTTIETITIPVLDDTRDEYDETFRVLLSDVQNATLASEVATGTIIDNDESMARAWLARFARTVTSHILDAVDGRLAKELQPGLDATIGGQPVNFNGARFSGDHAVDTSSAKSEGVAQGISAESGAYGGDMRLPPHTLSASELLLGSSFYWSSSNNGNSLDARWTTWARGAATRFTGADGALLLDGTVTTGTLGADYEHGRLLAGLAMSHSVGHGSFDVRSARALPGSADDAESSLTSVHPYLRFQVNDRLEVWGVLGYGQGDLALTQEQNRLATDIEMSLGIAGVRGALLSAEETGGFDLAVRSDALLTRIRSDAATDLPASAADVSRVRVLLEGSHTQTLAEGGVLTPSLQVGLRHDAGDAETGTGLELGAGLGYADPSLSLVVEVSGRGLLAHEDGEYEEWGVGGSVRLEPDPSGLGPSFAITTSFGESASGAEALWSRDTMAGLAGRNNQETGARMNAEFGYGLPIFNKRGVGTPYVRGSMWENGHSYLLGYKVGMGQAVTLHVEGVRREPAGEAPESGVVLRAAVRW